MHIIYSKNSSLVYPLSLLENKSSCLKSQYEKNKQWKAENENAGCLLIQGKIDKIEQWLNSLAKPFVTVCNLAKTP